MTQQSSEPIAFTSADGQAMVEGILYHPANPGTTPAALIACHGRWNTMDLPLIRDLCQSAAAAGIWALRFNFRYVTQKTSPSANGQAEIADMEGALAMLKERIKPSPGRTYLAGKSLGAIVASHVAAIHPGMGGYIALGYPLHGPGDGPSGDTSHLARLGCPALFVVGDRDPYCRLDRLQPVLDTITTSCMLTVIPGGDHSYRPPNAADDAYLPQAVSATLDWLVTQIGD